MPCFISRHVLIWAGWCILVLKHMLLSFVCKEIDCNFIAEETTCSFMCHWKSFLCRVSMARVLRFNMIHGFECHKCTYGFARVMMNISKSVYFVLSPNSHSKLGKRKNNAIQQMKNQLEILILLVFVTYTYTAKRCIKV